MKLDSEISTKMLYFLCLILTFGYLTFMFCSDAPNCVKLAICVPSEKDITLVSGFDLNIKEV